MTRLVLLGHGSADPRHAACIRTIAAALARSYDSDDAGAARAFAVVDVAFLDHQGARPHDGRAHDARTRPVVVVPLLLSRAYHATADVPAAVAAARAAVPDVELHVAEPLGPDPLLLPALEQRAREAGGDLDAPGTGTVLLATGSSDATARDDVAALAGRWFVAPRRGTHAFASGSGPTVGTAVQELVAAGASRVVLVPAMVAPGTLGDRAAGEARTAGRRLGAKVVVAAPLRASEPLLDLVRLRAAAARSLDSCHAAPPPVPRLRPGARPRRRRRRTTPTPSTTAA